MKGGTQGLVEDGRESGRMKTEKIDKKGWMQRNSRKTLFILVSHDETIHVHVTTAAQTVFCGAAACER